MIIQYEYKVIKLKRNIKNKMLISIKKLLKYIQYIFG